MDTPVYKRVLALGGLFLGLEAVTVLVVESTTGLGAIGVLLLLLGLIGRMMWDAQRRP